MADNSVRTPGTGETVRTIEKTGIKAQVILIDGGGTGAEALILGDATNGMDVDVTRLPALVAGTANIGDVDVLTVPAPLSTTGGGTEATALRVTVATDSTGVLSVDDNGGSITVDGTVAVSGSVTVAAHAVTNAGTFATQIDGAALTALQLLDDAVVADNAGFTDGTTKLSVGGFIYDEVAGTALTENDAAAARINLNRAQVGVVEDGVTRGRWATVTAANAMKVDGSAATQPVSGTVDTELPAAAALADSVANPTVPGVGAFQMVWDGATWHRRLGNATAGAINQGAAAHDAAVAGFPLSIGGRASTAVPTAVSADGDAVWAWLDRIGRQFVVPSPTVVDVVITSDGVTNATYASGDCVDDQWVFTNAVRANGGSGTIINAVLTDVSNVINGPAQLYLANASIAGTDNAAFAPSDAQILTMVGVPVNFPPLDTFAACRMTYVTCSIPFVCGAGTTSLYGVLVARSAYPALTPATVLQIRLTIQQD